MAAEYLAADDEVRSRGGFVIGSAVNGTVACRALHSWDEWHGGEALGVKILLVANLPAAVVAGVFHLIGESAVAGRIPLCTWSWIVAGVFMTFATAQWWLVGMAGDALRRRWREGPQRARQPGGTA